MEDWGSCFGEGIPDWRFCGPEWKDIRPHRKECWVPPTLADDLRKLLVWTRASCPEPDATMKYVGGCIEGILRKHGE